MSYGDGIATVLSSNIGVTQIKNADGVAFSFCKDKNDRIVSSNTFTRIHSISTIVESTFNYSCSVDVSEKNEHLYYNDKQKGISTLVYDEEFSKHLNIEPLFTVVVSEEATQLSLDIPNLEPLSILVESDRPPTGITGVGGGTGNGGLKNFRFITQKDNYFECTLNIVDTTVTEIIGLPSGIEFINGAFRGAPTISGTFYITLVLNDGSAIEGTIIVTQVPRKL